MSPWTALGWLLVVAIALPLSGVGLAFGAALVAGVRAAFRR